MVERMNCIQNQLTIAGRTLLENKVVTAIITGDQDNVQSVAGQMLGFFTELGCHIPKYAFYRRRRIHVRRHRAIFARSQAHATACRSWEA
jgi:hypothetical protein